MTTNKDLLMDGQSAAVFSAKGVDITPNKDRGVLKIVKRQGVDGARPIIGDRVTIRYTGKLLNGKKFDCSVERKESFYFNVGNRQVIKVWDISVLSMQKGEVCTILCKPEYAYGSTGNPPKIPPNSTLLFEVELLSFRGEPLTEDCGIIRRIKVKGDGYTNPNDGATVDVHLEGSCRGRLFDSRDVRFVVGEGEDKGVPLGVDRAMEKMQKGECCVLDLKPKYAFGNEGKPEHKIGPNEEVIYEVTLKDFQKAGRFQQAVIQYQRIVSWLEMECGAGREQQRKVQEFLLMSQLNLALCFLRLKEFSHAVENCNKVIELDGKNEKALYRRGEARLLRNEFSLAMADFRQVLQVNSSNRAARAQISTCQRKIREHDEQDKRIYANMFQKFAEHDAKAGKNKRRKDESVKSDENSKVGNKRRRRSQDCP
ncbi:peptidyl-prolyl cis-trans isomerase FKBP5 isoform X2 [Lampris incognitus]|uniref:peptidyl-prolyl cis-trans isomerase FKBP5 isoform X2 n=1 Tax=Lampris incognitus TaxID=2546036 RepID=UPI0024B4F4FB|nr:peptidyl-prolyl cis-trans isomerase FKBP5 isoform X2 [Lampris incognitus]